MDKRGTLRPCLLLGSPLPPFSKHWSLPLLLGVTNSTMPFTAPQDTMVKYGLVTNLAVNHGLVGASMEEGQEMIKFVIDQGKKT